MTTPRLSIITPLLNDCEELDAFFATLNQQQGVVFELLICDGGSTDNSCDHAWQLAAEAPFDCQVLSGEQGRARQMNAGARAAAASTLLFLHVDSRFTATDALSEGLSRLDAEIEQTGSQTLAGHYSLTFRRSSSEPSLPYSYYSCKARLDRPGCTHGDQGFMLRKSWFEKIGPFSEDVSVLEDTRLADEIRQVGRWILFPAEISTSARRFEVEGLYERQVLNLLIMNFAAIGWDDFFAEAKDVYRQQDQASRLRLLPFLDLIVRLTWAKGFFNWCSVWYRTGCYVRPQAWQIVFWFDVRRNFRQGRAIADYQWTQLERFDRTWDVLTNHVPGRFAAAVLTWIWFRWLCYSRTRCE